MKLVIALLILSLCSVTAQTTKRNQFTIGANYISFLDGQWAMRPSKSWPIYRHYGAQLLFPPVTYTRQMKLKRFLRLSAVSTFRYSPASFNRKEPPYSSDRSIFQAQIIYGRRFTCGSKTQAELGGGITYQNHGKTISYGSFGFEPFPFVAAKSTVALPMDVRIYRIFRSHLMLGASATYQFSLYDYYYWWSVPYTGKSERHTAIFSLFVGCAFGKNTE